ncbi:MAG: efflux RND transporter periplasmic adaptor subunit [Alphaproteobacteria bacterium]|nr:efflux RND transporter periplasmic adaptor subunit [Alphaproteobacteria bacterium]
MLKSNEDAARDVADKLGLAARAKAKTRQRLLRAAALVLVLAGGYAYWQHRSAASQAVTYETAAVKAQDVVVKVTATGTLAPVTEVDVSSQLSGVVREVNVEENAIVKKGDVLAVLDDTRLKTSRDGTAAKLAISQAAVVQAQSTLSEQTQIRDRQQSLAQRGISAAQTVDSAVASVDRAQAALQSAQAQVTSTQADLATIDTDLAHTIITAPIDGVILKRSVEPGQTVAASLQAPILFQIAGDLRELELDANVDEADIGRVKEGQAASFAVDAYRDRSFPAAIKRISFAPQTVDGVVTYTSVLSAGNSDLALRPGMTATAYITVASYPHALTVPNEALRYKPPVVQASRGFSITNLFLPRMPRQDTTKPTNGQRNLYVLRDGKPEAVPVELGASDGKVTIIKADGIKEGDLIISAQKQGAS